MTDVLISGAGIGGPTLAYWLARNGFRVTVVERYRGLRSSGNPIDVRGPAVPVAEAMGIMPRLREVATHATGMSVLNRAGRRVAQLRMPATNGDEVELARGDLAAIIADAARDEAEFRYDDTIVSMTQDADGVDVTFDRAAPRRFDLVVGADGLHSTVRGLAFGPEHGIVHHAGLYVATLPLGEPAENPHDILMYNTPGRLVTVHPARGKALVAFIFRGAETGFDYRDTETHKRIVTDAYAGLGWRVPELLDRLRRTEDLYFDAVSQVRLDGWTRGRVTLLGDAASCVSLFGDGSTLALAGAHALATTLTETKDHATALRRYEAAHRALVEPKQRGMGRAAALLVPKTRVGVTARNLGARFARQV